MQAHEVGVGMRRRGWRCRRREGESCGAREVRTCDRRTDLEYCMYAFGAQLARPS